MKLHAVMLVTRDNIFSEKAINSLLKSNTQKGINKLISIPESLYKSISHKIPKEAVDIIIQKEKPSSLWNHMRIITKKISTDYLIFLHDDDLIHKNFIINTWRILLKDRPAALATRVNFIGENDISLKNRQYIPRKKIVRLSEKRILQKYFSPFERCVICPTIAYERKLLIKYWEIHKRALGYGEDMRLIHFFAKTGMFLENQDSRLFKYRIYDGQGSTYFKAHSRLLIIAWLKKIRLNFLYKSLFIFSAKLQYLIYSKSNFSKKNFLGQIILKIRNRLIILRRGGTERK